MCCTCDLDVSTNQLKESDRQTRPWGPKVREQRSIDHLWMAPLCDMVIPENIYRCWKRLTVAGWWLSPTPLKNTKVNWDDYSQDMEK